MAYTAFETINRRNLKNYHIDGPKAPTRIDRIRRYDGSMCDVTELETRAISFIRNNCEGLRFDLTSAERRELLDLDGTSIKSHQIPYNMEKDIDRLTLEIAIHRFMESGTANDAFDVYFCFLEMFVGPYSKTRKMIESLAEFEQNASSLLMKHRDHYSHSVYNFLIGLAIYESNTDYRKTYEAFYGASAERQGMKSAHHFLMHWGLTSLFHDIGYPFELPFEEVKSYFDDSIHDVPFISYKNMDAYIKIPEELRSRYQRLGGANAATQNGILAEGIERLLAKRYHSRLPIYSNELCHEKGPDGKELPPQIGCEEDQYAAYLLRKLDVKAIAPESFNGYMDHAFFSANVLMKNLVLLMPEERLTPDLTDAITAILLHNSIFKFIVENQGAEGFSKELALRAEDHPLAFMLMLCDELQCWDRTSYGQNSRAEVHAFDCKLSFHEKGVEAQYIFDCKQEEKALRPNVRGTYSKMVKKADGVPKFQSDIEEIVYLNRDGAMTLNVTYAFEENNRFRKQYLSDSNFMHIYTFAVLMTGRKDEELGDADSAEAFSKMEEKFNSQSLEYKIVNLGRVKKFAAYLDQIGCFYTDRNVDYPSITEFSPEELRKMAPYEHDRWMWSHVVMGWQHGSGYEAAAAPEASKLLREQTRTHKLLMDETYSTEAALRHFEDLPESEKVKDEDWINPLIRRLNAFDGIRIYRLELK